MGSRIVLSLDSSLSSVDRVEHTAEELAADAGVEEDARFGISMAVREAAANAVFHGNLGDSSKQITASFENTGRSLIFCIADQGKGLDPDTLPDPPLKTSFAAPGAASFLSGRSWTRCTFANCTPARS